MEEMEDEEEEADLFLGPVMGEGVVCAGAVTVAAVVSAEAARDDGTGMEENEEDGESFFFCSWVTAKTELFSAVVAAFALGDGTAESSFGSGAVMDLSDVTTSISAE